MKSKGTCLLVLFLALSLFGCLEVTPTSTTISLADGQSQRFTAVSNRSTATVSWVLDGVQVATGNEYIFVAYNKGTTAILYTLVALEVGGNDASVGWNIRVSPASTSTCYLDEDGDGYGDAAKAVQTQNPPSNCVSSNTDCNDANAAINPAALESCNGIDDNCNGLIDGNTVAGDVCSPTSIPLPPVNVAATDASATSYDPTRLDITVTWQNAPGSAAASYFLVERSAGAADGTYEQVSDQVAGTRFVYSQNWAADVTSVAAQPAPLPNPTNEERLAFIETMRAYREAIQPALLNFKAPAYFRVRACNALGCSAPSAADLGRAELIHTQTESELAMQFYTAWSTPLLIMFGDMPAGTGTLDWCGLDFCGTGGGAVMGRLWEVTYREVSYCTDDCVEGVHIEVLWDNYAETADLYSGAYTLVNGFLDGVTPSVEAQRNQLRLAGDFTFETSGGVSASMKIFLEINKDNTLINSGWAVYTYKGRSYKFSLPINPQAAPVNGVYVAEPMQPIVPADSTIPATWVPSQMTDAWGAIVPLYVDPAFPFPRCVRNADETILPQQPECPGTSWDIDE